MGVFNTIVNIKNLITGDLAKVQLELEPVKKGSCFNIIVRISVADETLIIEGAFLKIQGVEDIEVHYKNKNQLDDSCIPSEEIVTHHAITSEQKIQIAEPMALEANEAYKWDAIAELAPNNQPVYNGMNCTHGYRIKAYIDCYGSDPDSGWVNLEFA